MSDDIGAARNVELGHFPYPLTKGPEESQYLTWLRNHSNYMATKGFLDYLRMGGVLVRGILLNFLILLSLLLAVSLAIGHLYGPQLRSLPSSVDLPLDKLDSLVSQLVGKERPVDAWLVEQLSSDTTALMPGDGRRDLQVALSKELRKLIAGESIIVSLAEQLVKPPNAADSPAAKGAEYSHSKPPETIEQHVQQELALMERRQEVEEAWKQGKKDLHEKARMAQLTKEAIAKAVAETESSAAAENSAKFPDWLAAVFKRPAHWLGNFFKPPVKWLGNSFKRPVEWLGQSPWGARMKTLSQNSRSQLRLENRLTLEYAYPQIRKLPASAAGPLYETGILPPMPVPFTVTRSVSLFVLILILISPILVLFLDIVGHRKSVERAGSDSSVKRRDKFERLLALALLAILTLTLFESLPLLVNKFHQFRLNPEMNWNAIFASVAGVSVTVMGAGSKLLSALGGAARKLATLLIGLLGVLAPLLVILYVTEFLVYHQPLEGLRTNLNAVLVLPIAFVAMISLGMLFGRRTLGFSEKMRLLGVLGLVIAGAIAMWGLLNFYYGRNYEHELKFWLVAFGAIQLWLFCRFVVDINRTSIHGLYRDRLASAYLVGLDTRGDVDIEEDINLSEIGRYEAGSTAPYHLVNVTLNLQGSKDISIRDRNSDFFVFSKRFVGGQRTGYCRTETLEQVHPQMNLATAMAISAAAASPNMGRGTNPAMVAFMVLLNVRLGYWLPNPGLLEENLGGSSVKQIRNRRAATRTAPGLGFEDVFEQELADIEKRWDNVYLDTTQRKHRKLHAENGRTTAVPTTEHGLIGLAFSGGGIRSATINLGIVQALHQRGVFDHVDYMSTVSGGGYLGSSISTLMRRTTDTGGEPRGDQSAIDGTVSIESTASGEKIVRVSAESTPAGQREHRFSRFDALAVRNGDAVKAGQPLIERHDSLWDRFGWRVRPSSLLREMMMKLDETHKWVNLSDGGHIENLAGIELLRRRCKFIIIGDGEADPDLTFNGLATLIRYARIDLGIDIDIHPDDIRVDTSNDAADNGRTNLSGEHWAFGTITYPPVDGRGQEEGFLLYLKSSCTGDEDEVIKEYRNCNPAFPHESTADQFFSENQFECYRSLGQHIGEKALQEMSILEAGRSSRMTLQVFEDGLTARAKLNVAIAEAALRDEIKTKWDTWLTAQQKLAD